MDELAHLRNLERLAEEAGDQITAELAVELLAAERYLTTIPSPAPSSGGVLVDWLLEFWSGKRIGAEAEAREAFETALLEPRDHQLLGELIAALGEVVGPRERLAAVADLR